MTTDEIVSRLLSPNHLLTPERFAKAKALAMRSKLPMEAIEALQALPQVTVDLVTRAHQFRVSGLQTAIVQIKESRRDDKERAIASLEATLSDEVATHLQWKTSQS